MSIRKIFRHSLLLLSASLQLFFSPCNAPAAEKEPAEKRFLYVAAPGIRNYLQYGGHGLLVFDIDRQHQFVKRIPTAGLGDTGQPLNVKGVCANADTKRIYIATT